MSDTPPVSIIMATRDGVDHLDDQIHSIFDQSRGNWDLHIFDGGSTDGTWELVSRYALEHPDRVHVKQDPRVSGSAMAMCLAALGTMEPAEYFMFCLQGDVWTPDKLSKYQVRMRGLETARGGDEPLAIHSDVALLDTDLGVLDESYLESLGIDGTENGIGTLLVQNPVVSRTLMGNRTLWRMLVEHPMADGDVPLLDLWVGQIAASCGMLSFISDPTASMRTDNQAESAYLPRWEDEAGVGLGLEEYIGQAALLLELYGNRMDEQARRVVSTFAGIRELGKFKRVSACLKNHILRTGRGRQIKQLLSI